MRTVDLPQVAWWLGDLNILLMAEIRRLPVEVGSFSNFFLRISYISGGWLGFQPSTVRQQNGGGVKKENTPDVKIVFVELLVGE